MLKKISKILSKMVSWNFFIILFLFYLFFSQIFFDFFLSNFKMIPDLKKFYTSKELYTLLTSYTEEERRTYFFVILIGDTLYPFVYSLFLFVSIAGLWRMINKIYSINGRINILMYIPFAAAFFDILENISVINVLRYLPEQTWLAGVAGYFTLLKWSYIYVSEGIVIILLIFLSYFYIRYFYRFLRKG